ncbi:hypothetical protein HDU96_002267 [Phlyctochytrium bullatum]|nr:hypothetical protein HDU96_002267 [Phlyctochytrium bullatum]
MDTESLSAPPAPWLQLIPSKLEEFTQRPSINPDAFRITLSVIYAAAHQPEAIDPVFPQRRPIRESAAKGTMNILSLLAHAAGGWHALSHQAGTNSPIAHHDVRINTSNHVLHGLEDLLYFACKMGEPAMVRFLASKIRHLHRMALLHAMDGDAANSRAELFVRTLSECLITASERNNDKDALEICKCLLFESEEDEIGGISGHPANQCPLVASLSLGYGKALSEAAKRGLNSVVDLFLSHPSLPTIQPLTALIHACIGAHEGVVSRMISRSDINLRMPPVHIYLGTRGKNDPVHGILTEADRINKEGKRLGHAMVSSAVWGGHVGVLRVLLADSRIDAGVGITALKLACGSKNPEMVLEVLSIDR